ncbi:PH domain-containing protein [Patescibacteria group bacterium]
MPDIYVASSKKRIAKEATKIVEKVGEKKTKNPLSAFMAVPSKLSFETQEKEEKIVLLLRKHWVSNVSWFFMTLILIYVPVVLRFFPFLSFMPVRFQLITVVFWYLALLAFVFEKFLSWFFNVYIITDERIIDVDFISLTYRRISDAQIEKIQDITYKTGGLLKAIFDYGDVYIQTAGPSPEIEFEFVPKPDKIARVLNQLIMQEQQEKIEGRVR